MIKKHFFKLLLLTIFLLPISTFLNAYEYKISNVKEVKSFKSNDRDVVVLIGELIQQVDGDEFIFADKTGQIEVEIDDRVWMQLNLYQPVLNTKLKMLGVIDKEFGDRTKLDITRIKLLEEPNPNQMNDF